MYEIARKYYDLAVPYLEQYKSGFITLSELTGVLAELKKQQDFEVLCFRAGI